MKRYIIATLIVLVLFFAFGFYKLKQRKMEYAKLSAPERYPYAVETVKPKKGTLKEFTLFRGYYEPITKSVLASKTAGVIKELKVHEGDTFQKGETDQRTRRK